MTSRRPPGGGRAAAGRGEMSSHALLAFSLCGYRFVQAGSKGLKKLASVLSVVPVHEVIPCSNDNLVLKRQRNGLGDAQSRGAKSSGF